MIDLTGYIPKKILDVSSDPGGFIVNDEDWNGRWNKNREQGDDTAQKLYEAIQNLYESAWHPLDGAASISHPQLAEGSGEDVGSQLAWLADQLADMNDAIETNTADILLRRLIETPITHSELTKTDEADCHPIGAITGLQAALDGIVAGNLEVINHNLLPNRDVADAHPISAITDLNAALLTLTNGLSTQEDRIYAATEITYGAGSVAQKFASIDATIAGLTGDMSEIAHNDLASRDAADSHPMSAITGLVTALAACQSQVLHGVLPPNDADGNDNDVYIKIAAA